MQKGETKVVLRVILMKCAQFNDFAPFPLKMSFPWPPERRCLCSHTFLIYFGRFWEGHLGKKPENAPQNHILMKSWSFYPLFIKKWFWRAFSGFLPKGPPKTPKKRHATEGFAPRDHGKQKRGQMCANGVILPHFHTFAAISPFFA